MARAPLNREATQNRQWSEIGSSAHVQALEAATQAYLSELVRDQSASSGTVPASVAARAQQTIGAQAFNSLQDGEGAAEAETEEGLPQDAALEQSVDEEEPDDEDAENVLPDPDAPDPAGPPDDPSSEDETPRSDDVPPPHEGSPTPGPSPPSALRVSGGGGGVSVASGGGSGGVMMAARQTAANMPQPTSGTQASGDRPQARTRRRPRRRQVAGPPPVPRVNPEFASVTDPIEEQTRAIEAVAERRLAPQRIPEIPASPGENTVTLPSRPLSPEDRRMVSLGERAMDDAQLSREGEPPLPGESEGGETRARLQQIRNDLLGVEPDAGDETELTANTPSGGQAPAAAEETADAEAEAPDLFAIEPIPLPPADMTTVEQEMYTAVIARLKAGGRDAAEKLLDRIKKNMSEYPGVLTNDEKPALDKLGKNLLPDLQGDMDARVDGIAEVIGSAGEVLDAAVSERRTALEASAEEDGANLQESAQLEVLSVEATSEARLADAEAARAAARDARQLASNVGEAPQLGFRQVAEAAVQRIQAKVSEAIAGFQMEGRERKAQLDLAKAKWISALDLAVLADQFDAERAAGLVPGRTHPANLAAHHRNAIVSAVNAAVAWRTEKTTFITNEIDSMKGSVDATVAQNTRDVQDAGAAAFRALRDWGNTQDEASSAWWQGQVDELNTWADNARDTAETWSQTEARLARMELQRGVQRARQRVEAQIVNNEEEKAAYQALTEDQRRNFIARNILNSDHLQTNLGRPMQEAVFTDNKSTVESTVESQLFALPRQQWAALEAAAKAKNGSFDAWGKATTIYNQGYDKVGTGESEIFNALSGLRNIERLAVTAAYNQKRGRDNALYNDLDDELSGDEWRRARDLMRGNHGAAAAEAIHDAVFGPGTGEPQIFQVLEDINRLPAEERDRALQQADDTYRARYGESLSSRLRGDLSGSELNRALALAAGNMDEARAHEMNYALGSRDANAAAEIYGRIQREELARARAEGWTPIEYQAAVARRNQALEREFGQAYGSVGNYNWGNGSTLEEAIRWNFIYDEGSRDRLEALQGVDLVGASAGEMEGERRSTYADDEVMGNVVSRQYQIAADMVDLERGYDLRRGVQRQVAARVRSRDSSGDRMTTEEIQNYRMSLDRGVDRTLASAAFDRSRDNVSALDGRLSQEYGISLDQMITNTMSDNVFGDGGDLSNARARIDIMRSDSQDPGASDSRRLDWAYVRMRSGIEGGGTDVPELRSTLSGLTDREIRALDARWRRDHPGESLREAIQSDTSGRDEGDLLDLYDNGMPKTVEEQVSALRRKLDRDEEDVGFIGAWASEDESRTSRRELRQLEAVAARMRDPNLTPDQREHLTQEYDTRRLRVDNAIEEQRREVDAFADTVTTVLGYVVSAIVIIASAVVTVISGGTASPALVGAIALAGSLVGTASTVAAKAAIKGGAYGLEELGTDLAVGAVDLAVTMVTAGLFKGGALFRNAGLMFSSAAAEIRVVTQQAIKNGIRFGAAQTARSAASGTARQIARETAEETLSQRAMATGRALAREQAMNVAESLPTTLTANFLNEENWVHGNFAENMLRGTWDASLQNLRDGAVMGLAGKAVNRGASRVAHVELTGRQRLDTDIRHWHHDNPGASPAEFARFVEMQAAASSENAGMVRAAQREARRSLLSEIPPRERGGVADVPIIHVTGQQFRTFNGGNLGDAMVHVQNGQAVIIIREGASPSSVARIGPELRDVVAPGTRGRTTNPGDSLPPRLRNRVPVDVVSDPTFGADEVRAVPQRDRDGNITGVALQVGPNARAIDIQLHVETVDAMRRYAGLAGQIRMFRNRMARRIGFDVIDPTHLGRWEASLEISKLPRIIDERMARLSEQGLDPRRRALVLEEIANLERQFRRESERFELGAAAESQGFVAAQSGKRRTRSTPEDPVARAERQARMEEASALKQRLDSAEAELAGLERERNVLEQARDDFETHFDNLETLLHSGSPVARAHEQVFRDVSRLLVATDIVGAANHLETYLAGLHPDRVPVMLRSLLESARTARAAEPARLRGIAELQPRINELGTQIETLRHEWREKGVFDHSNPHNLGDPTRIPCFAFGTKVSTSAGHLVNIEALKPGMVVDGTDGCPNKIEEVITGKSPHAVEITLTNGETVVATRNHPFAVEDQTDTWRPARLLYPGQVLFGSDGPIQISSVKTSARHIETANLIVTPDHVYRVGQVGVLVHNGKGDRDSGWASPDRQTQRIYVVVASDDPTVILYVGKTNKPSVEGRFSEHLRSDSKQLADVDWTADTHEVIEVASGHWSDYETAIWEEHFLRMHGGLKKENPNSDLINSIHAISDANIEFHAENHDPCR